MRARLRTSERASARLPRVHFHIQHEPNITNRMLMKNNMKRTYESRSSQSQRQSISHHIDDCVLESTSRSLHLSVCSTFCLTGECVLCAGFYLFFPHFYFFPLLLLLFILKPSISICSVYIWKHHRHKQLQKQHWHHHQASAAAHFVHTRRVYSYAMLCYWVKAFAILYIYICDTFHHGVILFFLFGAHS